MKQILLAVTALISVSISLQAQGSDNVADSVSASYTSVAADASDARSCSVVNISHATAPLSYDALSVPDTVSFKPCARGRWLDGLADKRWFKATYLGVPLIAAGLIERGYDREFRLLRNSYIPDFRRKEDNFSQYLPFAALIGMKVAGVRGRSSWKRMLISDAISAGIMAGTVNTMKHTIHSPRPNLSDNNSFPSGHTATAFMAATMLNKEYGHLSPWVGIGAYTSATATGLMRIANDKHWLSDVLVGAGIGILSVELGYWIADLICKDKGLYFEDTKNYYEMVECKPSFAGLYMGFHIPLSNYPTSVGVNYTTTQGTTAGLEGAYFLNRYWGVGGLFTVSNLHVIVDDKQALEPTLNFFTLMGGPYFNFPLSRRWAVGSKLLAGRACHSTFSTGEHDIKGNKGWAGGTGVSLSYHVRRHLRLKGFLDYSLLPPPNEYSSKNMHNMTLGMLVSMCF
ncbi:MAG: phosphatase PAP2 family protein [Prevotella sp.]|nr:phosphatase PAP2 family protein [Prevotella sp.]